MVKCTNLKCTDPYILYMHMPVKPPSEQDLEHFQCPEELPCAPSQSKPPTKATTILTHVTKDLLCLFLTLK